MASPKPNAKKKTVPAAAAKAPAASPAKPIAAPKAAPAKPAAKPTAKVATAKAATAKVSSKQGAKAPTVKAAEFFVTISEPRCVISNKKPADKSARGYATFEAAKSAAIDALVDTIEVLEEQLQSLKRAAGN